MFKPDYNGNGKVFLTIYILKKLIYTIFYRSLFIQTLCFQGGKCTSVLQQINKFRSSLSLKDQY